MLEDTLESNTFRLDINSLTAMFSTSLISVGRVEFNTTKQTVCLTLILQEDSAAGLVALANAYNQLTHLYHTDKNKDRVSVKLGISETIRDSIEDELIPTGYFTVLGVELNYIKSNIVYIKDNSIKLPIKTYRKIEGRCYLRKLDVYKSLPYVYADIVYQKSVENA